MVSDQPQTAPTRLTQALAAEDHLLVAPPPDTSVRYSLRHHFGDIVRYLYLMRFSLILWLSMLILAVADLSPGAATFTRGILTPFNKTQWFLTGFAVVLPGWFALLAARIVCAYGNERFHADPPPCFYVFDRMEAYVFWGAQIPGACLLARVAYNSVHEEEGVYGVVIPCLLAGGFAALVFWYLVSILYYWVWNPDCTIPARAFLVPEWSVLPLREIENISSGARLTHFTQNIQLLCKLGPGYGMQGRPGPGHIVATIALVCAIVLYFMLMAISAPVPVPNLASAARLIGLGISVYLLFSFVVPSSIRLIEHLTGKASTTVNTDPTGLMPDTKPCVVPSGPPTLRAYVLPFVAAMVMFVLMLLGSLQIHAPRAVPVLGYVIILLMVVFWTMAGIAFFADRFRLPVLTLTMGVVLALNHWPAEHVFPARPISDAFASEPLPSPPDYVRHIAFKDTKNTDEPVVIITATGGGIHAAAWTATALRALDKAFGDMNLHNHILLMSSVSGGSVATAGFLREYFTDNSFNEATYNRIQGAAACSSLQGVAWGLAYPDTLRLVFPWFFNLFPSLDRFDRGWALQQAIDRNFHDPECIRDATSRNVGGPDLDSLSLNTLARRDPYGALCLPHKDACNHFPAFTLNTTVVETGDRFLLSDYSVFAGKEGTYDVLPAASFLGVYGRRPILPIMRDPNAQPPEVPHRGGFADISLLTAARLSATFTYVSPAARLPFEDAQGSMENAYHFVDGGYYDNDGTNSAIEFLKAASQSFDPRHPLRVLLIEIRNTDDLNVSDDPDSYGFQAGLKWDAEHERWQTDQALKKSRFGPVSQILAPPEASIAAGFSSVTRRNRRELDTLESALCNSLELKHVVLDYQQEIITRPGSDVPIESESELDQPLSWHLTRRQIRWINGETDNALKRKRGISDQDKIQDAADWFRAAMQKGTSPIQPSDSCKQQNLLRNSR